MRNDYKPSFFLIARQRFINLPFKNVTSCLKNLKCEFKKNAEHTGSTVPVVIIKYNKSIF